MDFQEWIDKFLSFVCGSIFAIIMIFWGSADNYMRLVKSKKIKHSFRNVVSEFSTSAFVGVIIYMTCLNYIEWNAGLSGAAAGYGARVGGEAFYMMDFWIKKKLGISKND